MVWRLASSNLTVDKERGTTAVCKKYVGNRNIGRFNLSESAGEDHRSIQGRHTVTLSPPRSMHIRAVVEMKRETGERGDKEAMGKGESRRFSGPKLETRACRGSRTVVRHQLEEWLDVFEPVREVWAGAKERGMWKLAVANGRNTEKGGHERTGPRSIRGTTTYGYKGRLLYLWRVVRHMYYIVHVTACQWGLHVRTPWVSLYYTRDSVAVSGP
ncbi:hypothetical protein HD554DRAFT_2041262 [Boletus coccyginus]|nr:hypothetical protein HD554DRAFT_2041262 [Boletus coccyginus]